MCNLLFFRLYMVVLQMPCRCYWCFFLADLFRSFLKYPCISYLLGEFEFSPKPRVRTLCLLPSFSVPLVIGDFTISPLNSSQSSKISARTKNLTQTAKQSILWQCPTLLPEKKQVMVIVGYCHHYGYCWLLIILLVIAILTIVYSLRITNIVVILWLYCILIVDFIMVIVGYYSLQLTITIVIVIVGYCYYSMVIEIYNHYGYCWLYQSLWL